VEEEEGKFLVLNSECGRLLYSSEKKRHRQRMGGQVHPSVNTITPRRHAYTSLGLLLNTLYPVMRGFGNGTKYHVGVLHTKLAVIKIKGFCREYGDGTRHYLDAFLQKLYNYYRRKTR
jgi:hypothetical protein